MLLWDTLGHYSEISQCFQQDILQFRLKAKAAVVWLVQLAKMGMECENWVNHSTCIHIFSHLEELWSSCSSSWRSFSGSDLSLVVSLLSMFMFLVCGFLIPILLGFSVVLNESFIGQNNKSSARKMYSQKILMDPTLMKTSQALCCGGVVVTCISFWHLVVSFLFLHVEFFILQPTIWQILYMYSNQFLSISEIKFLV